MLLSEIFNNAPDVEIQQLSTDSRKKIENSIFFCLDGITTNGHRFIKQAISNGATAIVHSEDVKTYEDGIVYIKVDDVVDTLNQVVAKFYNYPTRKMTVYGVTGTNGKSSVTNMIRDIDDHFEVCGYIGTIAIKYKNVSLAPNLTTPDPIFMFKTLNDMVNSGVKSVALEVSSHGLEQKRVDAIDFDVAIFTNFTYDHLDFHGTMENYFEAKKKLFTNMKTDGLIILNVDDDKYEELNEVSPCRVVTYGINNECDYKAENIQLKMDGSEFDLNIRGEVYKVVTNVIAMYNIYNLLASMSALIENGRDIKKVIKYARNIEQIEGRLEIIDEGQPFNVIVDFAHTPDGLRKIFEYAKMITPEGNDIVAVFGSAGKRDVAKRPIFGEVASEFCNLIILTEDDPRNEDPKEIANEIKKGIKNNVNNIFIPDRYDAIRQAIEGVNENDTILILGKGDEVFMYHEEGRVPYIGDHNAAKEIINKYYFNNIE